MIGYLKSQDSAVLSTLHYLYHASSWFLLCQTREKSLRATICSFELTDIQCHGRAAFKQTDCTAIKDCKKLGYNVERHFIILWDCTCAVHCWNSSSSALSALLFLILMTSKLLEGAFTNLLSIVFSTWIVSNCFLECCVQWAQHFLQKRGRESLNFRLDI